MPCDNCNNILLYEPNLSITCPKCENKYRLCSQAETQEILESTFKRCIDEIHLFGQAKNLGKLLTQLNSLRNEQDRSGFYSFFCLTFGMKYLYDDFIEGKGGVDSSISINEINKFKYLCNEAYLNKHFLFFQKFDAIRCVYDNNPNPIIKFTEHWIPIYKRQFLMGIRPETPNFDSDLGLLLFQELHFRKIILEDLHELNKKYYYISETLTFLQNLHFHYPWREYLMVGWDEHKREAFLSLSRKLFENNRIKHSIFHKIEVEELQFMKNHWIYSKNNSQDFPFIFKLNNTFLVPYYILARFHQICDLFSKKNSLLFGLYKNDLGKVFENRIYDMIQIYDLDFHSPSPERGVLKRYMNPYKKGVELFDVGFIDHRCKKIYIIECKNKIQINLRTYNPKRLNGLIINDFEEFRDRDLPDIERLKRDWGLDSYHIIPMFYNLVPLSGEFRKFEQFTLLDGIYIIQAYTEIAAILNVFFHQNKLDFHEVYKIPNTLLRIIRNKIFIPALPHVEIDLGKQLREPEEKYLMLTGRVIEIDPKMEIPELLIKREREPIRLCLDIPPELWEEVQSLNLQMDDEICFITYRHGPYSLAWLLARIWKL